jgi:hypothetical protein
VTPLDTSDRAAELQLDILRRKTSAERLRIALDLSNLARRLAFAGIRMKHPAFSEREAVMEYLRRLGTLNE